MTVKKHLIRNAIKTPDGTVLHSRSVHDYKTHMDKNGETYIVDGGLEYIRRSAGHIEAFRELSMYDDIPHEEIREVFEWGSYGPEGDMPLHYIPLKNLEVSHIHAILETQVHVPEWLQDVFEGELEWRLKEGD